MALQLFPNRLVALRGVTGHGFSPGDHCLFLVIKQRACPVPVAVQSRTFLGADAEGNFTLWLTAEKPEAPGTWIQTRPGFGSVLVRQYFGDREKEEAAEFQVEVVGRERFDPLPASTDAEVARAKGDGSSLLGQRIEVDWCFVQQSRGGGGVVGPIQQHQRLTRRAFEAAGPPVCLHRVLGPVRCQTSAQQVSGQEAGGPGSHLGVDRRLHLVAVHAVIPLPQQILGLLFLQGFAIINDR